MRSGCFSFQVPVAGITYTGTVSPRLHREFGQQPDWWLIVETVDVPVRTGSSPTALAPGRLL